MKGAQWMDIRSDRQKGLRYVELGKKYHIDPRTVKRYVEPPRKPEYTLSEPRPTKMDPYNTNLPLKCDKSHFNTTASAAVSKILMDFGKIRIARLLRYRLTAVFRQLR